MYNSLQKADVGVSLNAAALVGRGTIFALPPRQTDQMPNTVTIIVSAAGGTAVFAVDVEGALNGDPTFTRPIKLGTLNALDVNGNAVLHNLPTEVDFIALNLTEAPDVGTITGRIRRNS
jgi:hypothetical protein